MFPWIFGIAGLAIILIALEREIYFYEGIHLGPRVQGWLYDRWAAKYDLDKHESQAHDVEVLARPMIKALSDVPKPLILDIATGTGRFPVALLNEPAFTGQMIALDISREMLVHAAQKLAPFGERVILMRHGALSLPFPDHSFDAVSCLEAFEVMPNMAAPLAELARVLRPGGVLLTTRGTEASGRVRKVVSTEKFAALLRAAGFEQIEIIPWWKYFDRVWARKSGHAVTTDPRNLTDVLQCASCGMVALTESVPHALRCNHCGSQVQTTAEGILLY